jgi:hypothetical protein
MLCVVICAVVPRNLELDHVDKDRHILAAKFGVHQASIVGGWVGVDRPALAARSAIIVIIRLSRGGRGDYGEEQGGQELS